jgi:hypothetical protein
MEAMKENGYQAGNCISTQRQVRVKLLLLLKNKKKGSEFMGGTLLSKTCRIITLSFDKSESQQNKIRAQF